MDRHKQLSDLVASIKEDCDKFYEGSNKAAGTRVRAAMLELTTLAKEIRVEVQSIKNEKK